MRGVSEQIRQLAVVCQNQKSRSVNIQTPDWIKKSLFARHQVQHRMFGVRIKTSGRIADRFVQKNIYFCLGGNGFAVESNLVHGRIGFCAELGYNRAIYCDSTVDDY